MTKVYITRVTHKHGDNTYVDLTREDAVVQLYGYVYDNWSDAQEECDTLDDLATDYKGYPIGPAILADMGEAIDDYFAAMEDRESYSCEECALPSAKTNPVLIFDADKDLYALGGVIPPKADCDLDRLHVEYQEYVTQVEVTDVPTFRDWLCEHHGFQMAEIDYHILKEV